MHDELLYIIQHCLRCKASIYKYPLKKKKKLYLHFQFVHSVTCQYIRGRACDKQSCSAMGLNIQPTTMH